MKAMYLFIIGIFIALNCNCQQSGIFHKQASISECDILTEQLSEDIYDALINRNGQESIVFSLDQYDMCNIKKVINEVRRIEALSTALIIANPDYTKNQLISAFGYTFLPLAKVGNDIIDYNPTYDNTRTFARYKNWILTGEDIEP